MPISSSLTASQFVRRFHQTAHTLAANHGGANGNKSTILAIRREDQSIWERRAPLAPYHVEKLTKKGIRILIQPSNRRAYPLQSYVRAGAEAREDISEAPVILGVKQVPVENLLPDKTYCFFSHTIKAQEANMPLLDTVLEKKIRLIDYERMVDERDQRVVAFGKYAGVAGMINILHGLGLRLLALGHHTPFMYIGHAHNYRNAGMAKQAIRDAGYEIALGKMPRSIGPLTFVFTGSGNVSQGAQEVFNELPIEYVDPSDLKDVAEQGSTSKIYGTIVSRLDHLIRKGGDKVDLEEYNQFPDRYSSNFSTKIAPHASVIINGVYWPPNAPRLLTIPDAKILQQPISFEDESIQRAKGAPSLPHRLIAICDISADPGGSIEFMQDCSTIDNPFFLYDSKQHSSSNTSFAGDGFLICSIDNMPTQLPLEATDMFGNLLYPHIMDIVRSNAKLDVEEHNFTGVVNSAIIASNGSLRPNYKYIQDLRQAKQDSGQNNQDARRAPQVLVLGAGHVSTPLIEYLCRDSNLRVTVVSGLQKELQDQVKHAQSKNLTNVRPIQLDVINGDSETLNKLIEESQLVVSLLPYTMHKMVAELCIKHRKNMVTASYLSQEMRELNERAKEVGVTIVNEVGLDPGIDHLLAKQAIDEISSRGGRINSFHSYCCGLPTPEFANNPLGYKFGWNPRGAFAVTLNSAKWIEDGQVKAAKAGGELMDHARNIDTFLRALSLEVFPNRNSLDYQQLYNLPDAKTLIRGTMRYKGFSETMRSLRKLNLLDQTPHPYLKPGNGPQLSWRQLMADMLGQPQDISINNLKHLILEKLDGSERQLKSIIDLGLIDNDDLVNKCDTPFNTIREKIITRFKFEEGDNDLIIMRIMFNIEWPDKRVKEERALSMVVYGDENRGGYSAMARTVGYPAAIASKMLLEGEIQQKGMVMPLAPEIYNPMLIRLKQEGIFARNE